MTNEQILQELSDVMKQNSECKRNVNEALTHATNAIRNMPTKAAEEYDKCLKEEYERGANDGYDACRKVLCCVGNGGLPITVLYNIFGIEYNKRKLHEQYSVIEIVQKIKDYENVKVEEETLDNELVIGDVVRLLCVTEDCASLIYEGIYVGEDESTIWLLMIGSNAPKRLYKSRYSIVKTGKHVDLFKEVLNE